LYGLFRGKFVPSRWKHNTEVQPAHIIRYSIYGEKHLACPGCNLHKAERTTAVDPLTGEELTLFHPVRQRFVGTLPFQRI
jgi:hypothetical protein